MAFVCGYFSIKGIKTISRTIEIFYIFVLIGIVLCALTSIDGINFDHILPMFENGLFDMCSGFLAQAFYRGNGLILLLFMGKIKFSNHFVLKFMTAKILATILLLAITLLFYLVYGPSAKYVEFALADLPQYNPFVSDLGRLNWLCVVVCVIALILTTSVMLFSLSLIIRWVFELKRSLIATSISVGLIVLMAAINDFSILVMEQKIVGLWGYVVGIGIILFLIITIIFMFRRRNEQINKI